MSLLWNYDRVRLATRAQPLHPEQPVNTDEDVGARTPARARPSLCEQGLRFVDKAAALRTVLAHRGNLSHPAIALGGEGVGPPGVAQPRALAPRGVGSCCLSSRH